MIGVDLVPGQYRYLLTLAMVYPGSYGFFYSYYLTANDVTHAFYARFAIAVRHRFTRYLSGMARNWRCGGFEDPSVSSPLTRTQIVTRSDERKRQFPSEISSVKPVLRSVVS